MSTTNGNGTHAAVMDGKNGGRLNRGNPGNKGGGRPPSEIREQFRGAVWKRRKFLERVVDGEALVKLKTPAGVETETLVSAPLPERLKAMELMLKYGIGTQVEATGADGGPLVVSVVYTHE